MDTEKILGVALLVVCMVGSAFLGRWLRRRVDRKRAQREEAARPAASRQVRRARQRNNG